MKILLKCFRHTTIYLDILQFFLFLMVIGSDCSSNISFIGQNATQGEHVVVAAAVQEKNNCRVREGVIMTS